MAKYIGKRLLQAVVILFGVSIIVFALVNFMPGNPYSGMYSPDIPPEQIEAKLQELGAYDPLPLQYIKWLGRTLRGDLGYSIWYKAPVVTIIMGRLGNTALLACAAILVSTLLGITVGIYSARHKKGIVDNVSSVLAFAALSIPSFFFGMILIKIFGVDLKVLPISGMVTVNNKSITGMAYVVDVLRHLILPTVVLGLMNSATMLRYTRSSMLDIQDMDYIRTARAKGLREKVVVYSHAWRNALLPVITVLIGWFISIFSGSLIIEQMFALNGMGQLYYQGLMNNDFELALAIQMFYVLIALVGQLITDLSYGIVDPRVRVNK